MTRSLTAALAALMLLTACGAVRESRFNPFNWFGNSQPVETTASAEKPGDARDLIDSVLTMAVEPYTGGVIVRATGLAATQGYWQAELVSVPTDQEGLLLLDFRVFPPLTAQPVSTPRSREVTAAITLSPSKLEYISRITVQGATNARSSTR